MKQTAGAVNDTGAPPRGGTSAPGSWSRGGGGGRCARRWAAVLVGVPLLAAAAALLGTARAADVTIALVPAAGGKADALEARQELRESPFGGYVLVAWPFGLSVDDQTILAYRTAASRLLGDGGLEKKNEDENIDKMIGDITGKRDLVRPDELQSVALDRRAAEAVELRPGAHVLKPFGIEFTVAADGAVATRDARARANGRRLEVLCHPVTVKTVAGNRSVAAPVRFLCDGTGLLGSLGALLGVYESKVRRGTSSEPEVVQNAALRRLTLYVPASAPGKAYAVNDVTFELDAAGRVKLAADAKARIKDGCQLYVQRPAAPPAAAAAAPLLGVSWFGGTGAVQVSCGSATVVSDPVSFGGENRGPREGKGADAGKESGAGAPAMRGGVALPVPANGSYQVNLGGLTVSVAAAEERWPHRQLVWDVAAGWCWVIEAPPLVAKPGAEWSCRLKPLAGRAPALPAALRVTLEAVSGAAPTGGDVELRAAAGGVFTGTLPAKPGFWRLRVAATDTSPLKGQTLGVALIGDQATAAVSLFTVNNRALIRHGDPFDLLWVARRSAGAAAAEWPVHLRGVGLDATVARISVPAGGGGAAEASGRLAVDTAALAAGEYTAAVEADGVAGYPFRFRICQRERLSDFDIYSFSIHTAPAKAFPGSPINSYVGSTPEGPGMAPLLGLGDGALDGVFGAYVNAPLGPVPEVFARPNMDERQGMAAAYMGVHVAPVFPECHSDEARNPKHTLPENLAMVRRRMTLTVQARADYPGLDGFDFGWLSSYGGYWESVPRLDAWQPKAAEAAGAWAWKSHQEWWPKMVAKYAHLKPIGKTLSSKWPKELADIPGLTEAQMNYVSGYGGWWDRILPNAFEEWFADVKEIRPGMTGHNHLSSPGLGNGMPYWNWLGKTHRSSIDFSEYYLSPFDGWRAPAVLAMDNREKQKIQVAIQSHAGRSEDIPGLFAAAGRGADGFAFTEFSDRSDPDMIGRARVFERFGSWFVSFDPLPDVALYCSGNGNAVRTALHDLARLRRPAIMVGPRDVEAGELAKYKVLLLVSIGNDLPPDILEAFKAFETKGGVILKDDTCHKDVPGRSIGLAYEKQNVSGGWGGAQAGGEGEHAWVWNCFLNKQETLVKAFASTPQPPITTPDTDVLISPLAGKDSIICFVINKTEIPLEVTFAAEKSARFRQGQVLPKVGELRVEKGWYVHNLLTGKAAPVENAGQGQRVPLELTGAEGAIYLLTRRKPEGLAIQVERLSPVKARLTGGLVDGQGKPLADPMPFEVTVKGPDGATLFRKFAAIGPDQPFDVPVPAMSAGAKPELVLLDLTLGTTATQALEPAPPASAAFRQAPDLIGGEKKIMAFFSARQNKGPVTILLDEGQEAYRPAAEKLAALLKQGGREARVTVFDPPDVRELHLRWHPQKADLEALQAVTKDAAWVWRVDKNPWAAFAKDKQGNITKTDYAAPGAGYPEAGPRLRHDADVILFGLPADHHAVADLVPWLRRKPTDNYPAPGCFFVHYVWAPFRAGYDALYVSCRDVAGAEAAVACLTGLKAPEAVPLAKPTDKPLMIRGGAPAPLENMATALGGTLVMNLEYTPSGNRLVATTFAYGDWLFVLDADGKVLEHLRPPETDTWPSWYRWGRWATPLSDTLLRVYLWDAMYQYELGRGWISKAPKSSLMEDREAKRIFMGGTDRLFVMDPQGHILWTYEDGPLSTDLNTVREVRPVALSSDRRVLLVSALKEYWGKISAPAIMGLDSTTGKVLWNHNGIPLHSGKVIPVDDRFIVMADDGSAHELIAQTGKAGTAMSALSGSPDWVLEVAGRKLLIAENNHINRTGPACRVYLRSLAGGADQDLKVPGRLTAIAVAPDKKSFVAASSGSRLLRFAADGTLLWDTAMPASCNTVRFSPDGKTVAASGRDGVARLFNAAEGKLRNETDLNAYNKITANEYAKQKRMGNLPAEANLSPKPPPPGPSYLKTMPKEALTFGPNLAPPEKMKALLKPAPAVTVTGEKPGYLGLLAGAVPVPPFKVQAGTTYLVELLDGVGTPADASPLLRLEVSVAGKQKARNLPCTIRLPVDAALARRRFAFRADKNDEVTLTLRPIMPSGAKSGNSSGVSFDKVETSSIPVVVGDVVVSAMRFAGSNVLFDGGPGSGAKPYGTFECTLYAVNDGVTATVETDVKSPNVAFQLVNGAIAHNQTAWDKISGRAEGEVAYADAVVRLKAPCLLSVIAVYEDTSGPVIRDGELVAERVAPRFAVEVRKAHGDWVRLSAVTDNKQLVNLFPCPAYEIEGIRYLWAGRYDDTERKRTDGFVRTAQIEAYASADALDVEGVLDVKDEELKLE